MGIPKFFSNLFGKVIHTFDIFSRIPQVSPHIYSIFRELVKNAIENLEYDIKREIYERMEAYAAKTDNRWDDLFVEMIKTRFPLGERIPDNTVKCDDCGYEWITKISPENLTRLQCPKCKSKNVSIKT